MLFDSNFGAKLTLKFNRTMKKLLLSAIALAAFTFTATAQDDAANGGQTSEGKWLIEANTGSWTTGNTSFSLLSVDGNTQWSVGAEAGYFIMDDLALKAGLGYSDGEFTEGSFVYKVGAKYYISSMIPVGVDFTGTSSDGEGANWIGLQGGYAIFLGQNVSIEPALRYNMTLDEEKADSAFQALIGFALHF